MSVFQPCELHIMFLILWFSLEVDVLSMKRIWLRFRSGIDTIMHVWLSIPDQLCCKIKVLSFWIHLNTRLNCITVENLSCTSVIKDNTTKHAYGHIIEFRNICKPDLLFQTRIHGCICYNHFSEDSECDTVSIPSDHILIIQWYFSLKYSINLQWYFSMNTW